ncbi:hypothetical protein CEB3_c44560 [Peptococcaceae bacterium CEB3]|nr:hypothetical protein CEB3_c44560 [Peptococcaceae bacterium CEB3]
MSLPQKEKAEYSYADYLTWPEDERWEIIDGIAYLRAAPSPRHQEILVALLVPFYYYLAGKPCKIYPAPFSVRLAGNAKEKDENIRKVVEPDITVVCDKTKLDDKGCHGAPDLIVEIVSPSSAKMDKLIKFDKYEKAGVKEYWLVEPDPKLVTVFTLQDDRKYGRPDIYTEEDTVKVSIFPDLVIDLKPVFDGV